MKTEIPEMPVLFKADQEGIRSSSKILDSEKTPMSHTASNQTEYVSGASKQFTSLKIEEG